MTRSKRAADGNQFLYYTFVVSNFLIFLQSLALLAIGVYLFILTEQANVFNIILLVIAIAIGIISLFSYKYRKNLDLMTAYLIIIGIVFLCQLIFTILLMANKNKILEWAKNLSPNSSESFNELAAKIDKHFDGVIIALWIFCGITVS